MKLRWIERKVTVDAPQYGNDIGIVTTVKVLQYWEAVDGSMEYGFWFDVPTVKEE